MVGDHFHVFTNVWWFVQFWLILQNQKKTVGLLLFGNPSESNNLPFQLFQQILKNQQDYIPKSVL
jgi:hypothetical protein